MHIIHFFVHSNLYFGANIILNHIESKAFLFECGEYPEILCGILFGPHNTIMDMNIVMFM